MPIAITEEQRAVADTIADWAARTTPMAVVRARADGVDAAVPAGLAEIGLFAIAVPAELGGADGTVADLAAGIEQAAAALAPGPLLGRVLAGLLLARSAGTAVAKELAPQLAEGSATAAVAFGADGLRATPTGDDRLAVQGRTGPVVDAEPGAHLLLGARSDTGGDVWFVLPPETRGVTVEPADPLDYSRPLGTVLLDDVQLDRDAVLPVESTEVADLAATLLAAEAAGLAGWCLRTASEYAKVREQFGKPIGAFQAVKQLCAEMLCRAESAAALAWDAARAADDDPDQRSLAAAVAAGGALDAAVANAKDCVQVLGGIGFTWEHDVHFYLRRAVASRALLGGTARWRRRAAALAGGGVRRRLDLDVEVTGRDELRAVAESIAAAPEPDRRAALAETGFLAPHWPKPYGRDASPAEQLAIDNELARVGVRRPQLVVGAWAAPTILRHGTDEQRERFVGPTLRGDIVWCQLFSEPGAGSDLAALRTRAVRTDGGWLLTGAKVWTSLAHQADWAICLARTNPDAPKHRGITYFLVDMRREGIEIRPLREITGEALFNEVFLTDMFVPDADVVGEVDGGWRLARTTLANERVALGGDSSVGEAVEKLLESLRDSGSVLDEERIGELVVEGSAGSLLDLRATLRRLDGQDPGAESSVCKLVGVRHRQAVAEAALEAAGPLAATGAAAAERQEFLRSRCLSIAGGTTEVLRNLAAERLLGLPRG